MVCPVGGPLLLQEGMRARPPFPSQQPEKRVLRLAAGRPALLPVPAPNQDNANSAVVLAFQAGDPAAVPFESSALLGLKMAHSVQPMNLTGDIG